MVSAVLQALLAQVVQEVLPVWLVRVVQRDRAQQLLVLMEPLVHRASMVQMERVARQGHLSLALTDSTAALEPTVCMAYLVSLVMVPPASY